MLMATFWFSILFVVVKHLGSSYSVYQIAFFRCFFALMTTVGMVSGMGGLGLLRTKRWKGHLFRAASGTISMLTLFYAYQLLPLAHVVAINFSAPLFITLFSMLCLREKAVWQYWAALIIGFIGILFIVNPTSTNISLMGVGIALLSAIFRALSMTGVRALGKTEPAGTTAFYFALQSTIFTALPMPWVWQTPGWLDFISLASCGVLAGLGQYFLTRAYQFAPAAVVSPFDYTAIIWATLFGVMFWGELPGWHIIIGSVIVILAGLIILQHEAKIGKRITPPATLDVSTGS